MSVISNVLKYYPTQSSCALFWHNDPRGEKSLWLLLIPTCFVLTLFMRWCQHTFCKWTVDSVCKAVIVLINIERFLLKCFSYDSVVPSPSRVTLPVYLNSTRAQLLFTVDFETFGEGSGKDHSFYERGVAVVASSLGS